MWYLSNSGSVAWQGVQYFTLSEIPELCCVVLTSCQPAACMGLRSSRCMSISCSSDEHSSIGRLLPTEAIKRGAYKWYPVGEKSMLRMVLTWPSSASMLCPDRRSHILPAAQHHQHLQRPTGGKDMQCLCANAACHTAHAAA